MSSDALEHLEAYRDRPTDFARDVLGVYLLPNQSDVLEALVRHPLVESPCGYSTGSTTIAAVATLWWVSTRTPAVAATAAPTERESRLIWREIRSLHKRSKRLRGRPGRANWFVTLDQVAFGAVSRPEHFQALIQDNVLIIEDGVPRKGPGLPIFGYERQLRMGRLSPWLSVPMTGVATARRGVSGLATGDWVDLIRVSYGEASAEYRDKVLGVRPVRDEDYWQ